MGKDIKLEWSFKFQSVNDLAEIILFRYPLELRSSYKKETIAKKIVKSGAFKYAPGYKKHYVCKISFTKNGIGRASISILNAQFSHTHDYGISLKMTEEHLPSVEKSVLVKVVGKRI